MINNDALDNASLRYLAGLKQIISECSMSPVSLPTASPHTPANISITAGSGDELSQMLKNIMSIAGVHKVEPQHMPVISTEPTMAKVNTHPSMKELVGKMDAIDHLEDSMNSGERPWDTSPHEEILNTEFPQDGDQNNNAVAAKDERVSRQHATSLPEATLENLFSAYKNFVAEESKPKCCCKAKGKSACPVHGKKKVKESTLVFGNEDPEARKIAKELADSDVELNDAAIEAKVKQHLKVSGTTPEVNDMVALVKGYLEQDVGDRSSQDYAGE